MTLSSEASCEWPILPPEENCTGPLRSLAKRSRRHESEHDTSVSFHHACQAPRAYCIDCTLNAELFLGPHGSRRTLRAPSAAFCAGRGERSEHLLQNKTFSVAHPIGVCLPEDFLRTYISIIHHVAAANASSAKGPGPRPDTICIRIVPILQLRDLLSPGQGARETRSAVSSPRPSDECGPYDCFAYYNLVAICGAGGYARFLRRVGER